MAKPAEVLLIEVFGYQTYFLPFYRQKETDGLVCMRFKSRRHTFQASEIIMV